MSNEGKYFLAEGDTFLLPTNAIYRMNDKLDDASDLSSVYSNEPESAICEGSDAEELYMDDAEFTRRLYKFGLDINGLPLRDDLLFKTFDKAANFTLKVPHIALWDYFGGTSCLDINCTAGDQINVLCEEYQVREIDSITSDGRTFLRLPMQWSLGQWVRKRSFQSNIGLIPSCWLIKKKNKRLFDHPTWFLGITDLSNAYDYLLEDRSSYRPAAEGAQNEMNAQLTSSLYSPTVKDQTQTGLRFPKESKSKKDASMMISSDTPASPGHQKVPKESVEKEYKDENKFGFENEDIDLERIEHTSLPFYIKAWNFESNFKIHIPAPFISPTRDIYAMTMKSEQWAARYFDQITEPVLLSQPFSFISRSIFDPNKKSHMEFAQAVQLSSDAIEEARSYMKDSLSKKSPKISSSFSQDPIPAATSTDESVLKTNDAIEIDISNLKYSPEDILGSGAFGAVYRGKLETADGQEVIISHPNVMKFYGFCYDETKEYVMLTFELMDIGSLADFMKAHEYNISENEHVDFLMQIARGMAHLHSFNPPIVHGDLAARNVLLCHHPKDQTRYLLKISDFGLSKTTRHEVHFLPDDPQKMPFKWLPPEVLHRRELNIKSDVWAYAILATEIYGVVDPYGMLPNEKVLSFLKDDHQMEKPSMMPYYIYNIILRCWRKQPVDRPNFNEIVRDLMPYYIEYESSHIALLTSRIIAESTANKKVKEPKDV
ncbi:unnamed protein product [Onchocerca ochengi]|uniref:Protein kinase domain-containing protein n=1 Tax=Onchocerca ochengi TaxID=42157 RepID=A0A182EEN1_ONCOC|nr:unnamed protein product [Onchocerca ochengi]VDK76378.1 unnamed protein product [Onchocerca ochengi]VDK82767.1 unnamed protein product [Onchocerca ochengi]